MGARIPQVLCVGCFGLVGADWLTLGGAGRSWQGELVLVLPSGVHVDAARKLVHVEAGSLWQHVDWELALFGLCVPSPIVHTIGVAGSTLGGGWGYVSKQYGMSCDSVVEAEMVTADGKVLVLNRETNRDLFWATVRGASAVCTLGVVTRLTFKAYPAPAHVYHGLMGWDLDAVDAGKWGAFADALLRTRSKWPLDFICYPVLLGGKMQLMIYCPAGEQVARQRIAPLLEAVGKEVTHNDCSVKTYLEAQRYTEATFPEQRAFMKSRFVVLTRDLFLAAHKHMSAIRGNPHSRIVFQNYFDTPDEELYLMLVSAQWDHAEEDATMRKWVESAVALAPKDLGSAVNFAPKDTSLQDLFEDDDVARITRLKKQYDPHNFWARPTSNTNVHK